MKINTLLTIGFLFFCCTLEEKNDLENRGNSSEKAKEYLTQYERFQLGLPYKSDKISLISTIGGEDSKLSEDFLIISPETVKIHKNGDILLVDGDKIKVYDNNWHGKQIIGRKERKPVDFAIKPLITLSSQGFITALEIFNSSDSYYSVFDPEYKFIYKKRFYMSSRLLAFLKEKGISDKFNYSLLKLVVLDSNSKVYCLSLLDDKHDIYNLLAYENKNNFIPIKFREYNYVRYGKYSFTSSNLGLFLWRILSDNMVLYFDSSEDKYFSDSEGEYVLHLFSIEKNQDAKIYVSFLPVLFSESFINKDRFGFIRNKKSQEFKRYKQEVIQAYKKQRYFPAVFDALVDSNYLFIFLHNKDKDLNTMIHVIDVTSKKVVNKLYSPFGPLTPNLIRNGFVYNIEKDPDEFNVIRIYKLHPSVYGK